MGEGEAGEYASSTGSLSERIGRGTEISGRGIYRLDDASLMGAGRDVQPPDWKGKSLQTKHYALTRRIL